MDHIWIIWVGITVLATLYFIGLVFYWKRKGALGENRRFSEQIPSLLSTWGVLGTFVGIAYGLYHFNPAPAELTKSIEILLEGMKTAFFTSLAGMGCSLILQQVITKVFDKTEKISDISVAAGKIVDAVGLMQKTLAEQAQQQDQNQVNFYKVATDGIQSINSNISVLANDIAKTLISINAISMDLTSLKDSSLKTIIVALDEMEEMTKHISANSNKIVASFESVEDGVGEINDAASSIVGIQEGMQKEVVGLGEKLHSEVLDIEDQMARTTNLLNEKFNEFSELLKKSNTEALVEVMKGVTEEFEKQMNELISRLVQENFQKLNESVEKLNVWQVENKEMIQSLTSQYREMTQQFEGTSNVLTAVGEDTKVLVSDGGKLNQIVSALNKVMVDDDRFVNITENLSSAAVSVKDANELFDQSAQALSTWVLQQKKFADSVNLLLERLEEINKINDYSDVFWSETKQGMNDSLQIIKSGALDLQRQIASLDQSFYRRLSDTLAELENLITSFLNSNRR